MTDNDIKKALELKGEEVKADEILLERIYDSLDEKKEVFNMKKYKKAVVAVCAAVLMFTTGAFAAGKIAYTTSSSSRFDEVTEFPTEEWVEEEVGYLPKYVEALGDYGFNSAVPANSKDVDEEGNVIATYKDMQFYYDAGEGNILALNTCPHNVRIEDYTKFKEIEIEGVTAYYRSFVYKTFPDGYEVSDEDLAREEAGELMIAYGGADMEIEERETHSILWDDDGIGYNIMSMGLEMTEEEMIEMAREVITSE